MDFCTIHFGKALNDLAFQDVVDFFKEERSETDQLEFKSINPSGNVEEKFLGIQRSCCAFLNSSGGLLIWGAPDGKKIEGKKEKVFKGDLTPFLSPIEKDYVISKISDNINPLPSAIRLRILSHEKKSIVLIEVDTSEYSPHQTRDVYFMRIDGQTRPAPHHYIEALFKKIKYPNIEVFIRIKKAEVYQPPEQIQSFYKVDFDFVFFNWSPLQNEEMLSYRLIIESGVFSRFNIPQFKHQYRLDGREYFNEKAKEIFYFGEPVLESETILFYPQLVSKEGNKAKLLISFGGRFSPRKSSEYTIDFSKIYEPDPNKIIVEKIENMLTKDIQDSKGIDKVSVLKTFRIR